MDIIIGVGGTGAKVVEAAVHMATIGIGPTELRVGFVDQDKSNGNLNRAQFVLSNYVEARAALRGPEGSHKLVGTDDTPMLRTDIQTIDGGSGLWVPDERSGSTLSSIFGAMQEDRYLFDALFETEGGTGADGARDEEQDMPLDQGYRGRPHLGAAAISARANSGSAFWDAVTDIIKGVGSGGKVNIMIAGSVFGGTGAAGFPTLARIIREKLREENISSNVHIGGILMLPYFGYPDPDEDANQNVARANEQLMQSRGALHHYEKMLSAQHIFDQLYLIGWSPFFVMDYHQPGAGDQRNPALLPEMLAASAAVKFFTQPPVEADAGVQRINVSARADMAHLGWSDIPAIGGAGPRELHERFGQFLRFAAAFKFWKSYFDNDTTRKAVRKQAWYKAQGLDALDWQNDSAADALHKLDRVVDDFIGWAGSMEAYARKNPNFSFNLWNASGMVRGIDFAQPNRDPVVAMQLSDQDYAQLFNSIAHKYSAADDAMPTDTDLADGLTEDSFAGDHKGMGAMIAALYTYSSVTEV